MSKNNELFELAKKNTRYKRIRITLLTICVILFLIITFFCVDYFINGNIESVFLGLMTLIINLILINILSLVCNKIKELKNKINNGVKKL